VDSDLTPLNEEQLRANRFELVSRLADDLAHEIKNPLNSIVINLEVLKVRVGRGDAGAALERAAVIEQEARRLHHMIDRLLQLIRPDREEAASLALDQVLDELLPLVEARARLARNTFRVQCDASVYLPLPRDTFKFALLNLLTAVHERLGEDGGMLSLRCDMNDGQVQLHISADPAPTALPIPTSDAAYRRSLDVAAALIASCGGRLEDGGDDVTLHLPRV
jgi:signal transduction histidine kinase